MRTKAMSAGYVDSKVDPVGLLLELLAQTDGRPMALHSLLVRHGMTDLQGHVSWQGAADWILRQQLKANGRFLLLGSAPAQPQPRRSKGDHQARANLQPERNQVVLGQIGQLAAVAPTIEISAEGTNMQLEYTKKFTIIPDICQKSDLRRPPGSSTNT
ncbi:MAG: hypothetical protein ACK5Q6_04770 [Cyanobacteriota bacterium]